MKHHWALVGWLLGLLLVGSTTGAALAQSIPPPNDSRYAEQWALTRIGGPCVWQHTSGSTSVTVAVVDSGVDLAHPDLAGQLRSDGYDFVDDDPTPADENGHGTHVSGIIAARAGNGAGIAGVSPGVRILPVRVINAEGWGSDEDIARGIRYAVGRGAQIINLSLGTTLWALDSEPGQQPSPVREAVRAAQANGALVVVAAGNDFVPLPNAIAFDNPEVMLVAASTQDDVKAAFSNSGPWVDVVAPGQHILSTMPTYEVYLTSDALAPTERFRRSYDYMSGTSQAAPHVAALAALLFSAMPDASAADIQARIQDTANSAIYQRHPPEYRRLWELGAGRIDACALWQE